MKKIKTLALLTMVLCMVACANQREKDLKAIVDYENSIDINNHRVNIETGENLILLYINFCKNNPADSLAPVYMAKAADVAANIGRIDLAIKYLDKVIAEYPNYEKVDECYFFKGFVYETVEKNTQKAQEAYTAFVEKYPTHPWAEDTKKIIENLSLSDAELLEMIKANNATTNSTL